jgi:hypothetical protein
MPTTLPERNSPRYRRPSAGEASQRGLLGASLFVALAFSVVTGVLPAQLVLPAMSVIVVLSGLLVGVWALLVHPRMVHPRKPDNSLLDIAGVLVLFGFAAAILCDKSEAIRLLSALPGA